MALAAVPTMWPAMAKPGVEKSPARRPAAALCPTCRQRGGWQPSPVRQGLGAMAPKLERAGSEQPERRHRQTASATRRAKYDRRESRRAKKGNGLALLSDRYPAPKNPIDLTAAALRRRQCEVFRISLRALRPGTFQSRRRRCPAISATLCEISRPVRQAGRPRKLQTRYHCWPAIVATTLYPAIQSSCDAPNWLSCRRFRLPQRNMSLPRRNIESCDQLRAMFLGLALLARMPLFWAVRVQAMLWAAGSRRTRGSNEKPLPSRLRGRARRAHGRGWSM